MARFYVPLDVNYQFDDKIMSVGHAGECLYVRGLAYAKRAATEGKLHRSQLPMLALGLPGKADAHAAALEVVGLWEPTDEGWYITGWLKHNLSNGALAEQKAKIKTKSIAGNHKQHHAAKGIVDPDCELCRPPNRDPDPSLQGSHVGAPQGPEQGSPQGPNRRRTENEDEQNTNRTEYENEKPPHTTQNGFSRRANQLAVRAGEIHGTTAVNRGDGHDRFALAGHMTNKLLSTQRQALEEFAARADLDDDTLAQYLLNGRPLPPPRVEPPPEPEREPWVPPPAAENTGDYRAILAKVLNHPERFLKEPETA